MASYKINWIQGEYVDLIVKIGDREFDQNLCGMPTDDKDALIARIEEYVRDYEDQLLNPPTPNQPVPEVISLIDVEQEVL